MIVLDLDGTLLNNKGKVSGRSRKYLKRLKNMGYIIVIATGRIYESINCAIDGFDFVNYVITDTGATCYDVCNDNTIFNNPIELKNSKSSITIIVYLLIFVINIQYINILIYMRIVTSSIHQKIGTIFLIIVKKYHIFQ